MSSNDSYAEAERILRKTYPDITKSNPHDLANERHRLMDEIIQMEKRNDMKHLAKAAEYDVKKERAAAILQELQRRNHEAREDKPPR